MAAAAAAPPWASLGPDTGLLTEFAVSMGQSSSFTFLHIFCIFATYLLMRFPNKRSG
jgi:hypothetical protein